MRGTGRNLPSRILVGVFGQPFGLDGDRALIVIADEMDLLDVPLPEYGLHFRPFDLGRLRAVLAEQHPADSKDQEDIEPREIDPYADNLPLRIFPVLPVVVFRILCHDISLLPPLRLSWRLASSSPCKPSSERLPRGPRAGRTPGTGSGRHARRYARSRE